MYEGLRKGGGTCDTGIWQRDTRGNVPASGGDCNRGVGSSAYFRIFLFVQMVKRKEGDDMKIVTLKMPKCLRGIVKAIFKM